MPDGEEREEDLANFHKVLTPDGMRNGGMRSEFHGNEVLRQVR